MRPCFVLFVGLGVTCYCSALAQAAEPELPPLAKMRDANKNNRIERNEACLLYTSPSPRDRG